MQLCLLVGVRKAALLLNMAAHSCYQTSIGQGFYSTFKLVVNRGCVTARLSCIARMQIFAIQDVLLSHYRVCEITSLYFDRIARKGKASRGTGFGNKNRTLFVYLWRM